MVRHSSSASPAPAPPLEDENLPGEILLRLPPQPSSLPRASLVCKRWRRLVSHRDFLRRFRSHHRKPPLLGLFSESSDCRTLFFTPTLDPPDRIPAARFALPRSLAERVGRGSCFLQGCRDGLALFMSLSPFEAIVWDPVTGSERCVAYPPGLNVVNNLNTALLPAAGDDLGDAHHGCRLRPFRLALAGMDHDHDTVFACLYESESGLWGDLASMRHYTWLLSFPRPSILVGNALYWELADDNILEFDFERQSLAVIQPPAVALGHDSSVQILRTESSGLGLAILARERWNIEIWERKSNSDGVVVWVLQKTVNLDKLLPLRSSTGRTVILGYAEDCNEIFLCADNRDFMIQLESMEFKLLVETNDSMPEHRYVQNPAYPYPIRIGYRYDTDTARIRIHGVSREFLFKRYLIRDWILAGTLTIRFRVNLSWPILIP